jgi:DNA-binding MarR family transcriptional regulator
MLDKMSNASRLVDKLVEKGFAERTTSLYDRRQVDVLITEKGKQLLSEIEPELATFHDDRILLDEGKATKINDALDLIRG